MAKKAGPQEWRIKTMLKRFGFLSAALLAVLAYVQPANVMAADRDHYSHTYNQRSGWNGDRGNHTDRDDRGRVQQVRDRDDRNRDWNAYRDRDESRWQHHKDDDSYSYDYSGR
jgi:hypothetical protein